MRRMIETAIVLVAVLLTTGSVCLGASLNWEGTATVHLYPEDWVNPKFPGGGVATVNGSSGALPDHLNSIRLDRGRGLISGEWTHVVTDPEVAGSGLAAVRYLAIEAMSGTIGGSFTEGRYPGAMGVRGIVQVCLLSTACTTYVPLALTQPTTVNGVPGGGVEGLGIGGLLTMGGYGGIRVSVQMAPWTVKTVTGQNYVETPSGAMINSEWTMRGWAHGPQSGTSSTAAVDGGIQLVTPAQIETNVVTGFGHPSGRLGSNVGSVISVTIRFVPEPGLGLMLAAGVGGLIVLGRQRG